MNASLVSAAYLLSCILFILSIRGLASPETARKGNLLGIAGMSVAVGITFFSPEIKDIYWILLAILIGGLIGTTSAFKVKMTSLPQMVAAFNGLGGLSSVFISLAEITSGSQAYTTTSISLFIGAVAFSGSVIAFANCKA